ncbi:MAG: MtnX-like HAD-IB family phosphatase, partial [Candidatus Omnitrophota bacterium]
KQLRFFVDFDGTITQNDVVDMILERFASREWRDIEKLWVEGKIGSRECLSRQMQLVSASDEELKKLLSEVQADPYFVSFLRTAKELGVPVSVVSDGFERVIRDILLRELGEEPELLQSLPVYANRLIRNENRFEVVFPEGPLCEHYCANCKPALIREERQDGEQVIFVGDGLSDRFAALESNFTFAKKKLLDFCRKNRIQHREYTSFKEIEAWLAKAVRNAYAVV